MAKFKIGDKVRILDGSKIENYTGSWASRGSMDSYIGTIQTISDIDKQWSGGRVSYDMKGIDYAWDERGLELVTEKKQPKFKVGNIVIGNKKANRYGITREGWIGTITRVNDNVIWVAGPELCGHDGRPVNSECFDLVMNNWQKIVITTDGRVTKATMYEGKQKIGVATSTCHPSDEFDFNKGAAIALERLTGQKYGKHADAVYIDEVKHFDWDGFKAGKFNVVTNRGNIDRFLEECEAHGINWPRNKATEWNPIKRMDAAMDAAPDFIRAMLKATLEFESNDKCEFKVTDGNLGYSFSIDTTEKTVIYDG